VKTSLALPLTPTHAGSDSKRWQGDTPEVADITQTRMASKARIRRDIAQVAGYGASTGLALKCSATRILSPSRPGYPIRCNLSDADEDIGHA